MFFVLSALLALGGLLFSAFALLRQVRSRRLLSDNRAAKLPIFLAFLSSLSCLTFLILLLNHETGALQLPLSALLFLTGLILAAQGTVTDEQAAHSRQTGDVEPGMPGRPGLLLPDGQNYAQENRTRLLQLVNDVAAQLLASNQDNFGATLTACMEKTGSMLGVDRVYVWKNHLLGDALYCTQLHEWSGGAVPQQGNELTVSVPFPEDWRGRLSTDRCVNGVVATFPVREREHLQAQNIISILVVPVFLQDEFWGFVGFDDCRHERLFSETEEGILRSISLLFASAQLRNEITINLISAREEALSSSRAKTDFLANMSHEIRTPISAIMGMSGVARQTDTREKTLECLDHIDTAAQQLLAILNDVLDMSRIEAGKMRLAVEPFDLDAMLGHVFRIFELQAEKRHQHFSMNIGQDVPRTLMGDEVRVIQILSNLLSNAIKFTPEGGDICLEVTRNKEHAGLEDEREELELAVVDNGIGLNPRDMERLFFKFEQAENSVSRSYGGAGLGLAICKSLAEMMGGGIRVDSEIGKGSRFSAHFPLQACEECRLPAQEEERGFDFSGRTALLVEDIEINREIVLALLGSTGLEIDQAENGQVALEKFSAAPSRYDLILMDIHMPIKDGYSTTRAIRALDLPGAAEIPIIAMTANAFPEDVQRCLEAGMNDHVAKPVDFAELGAKIEACLPPVAG